MDFGFTGCHSSVPSLQRLAVYTAEALEELEAAFLPRPKPSRKARHPRAVATSATTKPAAARRDLRKQTKDAR
jgi:hypothetical protein